MTKPWYQEEQDRTRAYIKRATNSIAHNDRLMVRVHPPEVGRALARFIEEMKVRPARVNR